jgi:hypothetical protein
MKKIIQNNFDVDIDTFKFSKDGNEYNALSKFESINAGVFNWDTEWEETLIKHIKWQLYL